MHAHRFVSLLVAVAAASVWGCGRTALAPGDEEDISVGNAGAGGTPSVAGSRAVVGRGGAPAAGGGAAGGVVGSAGAVSVAGMPGAAGMPSGGAAGAPPNECAEDAIAISSVAPANGAVSAPRAGLVKARFNCAYDPALATHDTARLYGQLSGYTQTLFPTSDAPDELWIAHTPHFAGEAVTGWLGAALGGPYLWSYTARTSSASPGIFRAGSQDLSALPRAADTAIGDLDGDGDVDVVVGHPDQLVLLLNRGDGTFSEPQNLPGKGAPVVVGDVDRDGDLDVAGGEQILLNDGDAQFVAGLAANGCLAMGDLDGDGDLDCVANTGWDGQNRVFFGHVLFNEAGAGFTIGPQTEFGFECELADFDHDGDLDAVCVPPVIEGAHVFLNDGHGAFTQSDYELGEAGARAVAIGDLDLDGDVDIVVSHWNGPHGGLNQIWTNDGSGYFRQAASIGGDSGDLELGDLDGDGDLDALASHLGLSLGGPYNRARIYLNDGEGQFTDSGRRLGEPAFHWFELADFDGDQDLDAFVYHQKDGNNDSALWFNEE